MKPLLSIGAGVILVAGGIVFALNSHSATTSPSSAAPPGAVASQSPTANAPAPFDANGVTPPMSEQTAGKDNTPPPMAGPNDGAPGQHGQRMQRIFDQLGLSDAQKQQIAQIRQTVTDRRERHEQIMNVLTPDQRAKFQELRAQFHGHHGQGQPGQPGATAPTTPPAST